MEIKKIKIEQIDTRSEYFQDIIEKVPNKITRYGNTAILALFSILTIGLSLIRYPEVVEAQATITTSNPPIEVYSKAAGRIQVLLKKEQENVKVGDWVIILNNNASYTEVIEVSNFLNQIRPSTLETNITSIVPPQFNHLGDLQHSYYLLVKYIEELKLFLNEENLKKNIRVDKKKQFNLDLIQKHQIEENELLKRQVDLAQINYKRYEILYNQKVISKSELEAKENELLDYKAKLEVLQGNMRSTSLQKNAIDKDYTATSNDNNKTYFNLKVNILQEYNSILFELEEWKNKYVISAPISGLINLYNYRSINQYIPNETNAFTISPIEEQKKHFAILKLPLNNSGKININQPCIIKLNGYPYTEYGFLKGQVASISNASRDGYYNVKVELPRGLTTSLNKTIQPKGDLIGGAEIIINDINFLKRLFNSLIQRNS